MRHVSAKSLTRLSVLSVVIAAIVLASAIGGNAAGKNICATPGPTAASCVQEFLGPHFISAGKNVVSVTEFTNESGVGGSTATHVVLSVTFPTTDVTIASVNGVSLAASGCTSSTSNGQVTISCAEGNVAGGATVKLTVVFSTSSSMVVLGGVSYGEGGGTPGQPINSVQGHTDTLTVSGDGSADGGCFGGIPPTIHGSNALQQTFASVGTTAADTSLPCTFVDAGVLDTSFAASGAIKSQISFVEFPTLAQNGVGTVRLLFTPLPDGVKLNNTFKLREDTNYAVPYFTTFVTVPNCDRSGNIPAPVGIPAKGATDSVAHSNDSCIFNKSPLPNGGGEVDLHVIGSPFDSHYGT
jgi:hypothetical protein